MTSKIKQTSMCSFFALLVVWMSWIAAISTQSATPKLMWSVNPLTPAVLESPTDMWVDVPDTRVALELLNQAVVVISYDVSVSHSTDVQPEGTQVAQSTTENL
ncbi:hypothetical protein PHPALM_19118 [Phytophthora palmivora]|uniref:Uncharacterized protein n=1 Tax=Phytophthora palmivora TaxID=4796 RepID=A0A2P4XI39_9STRA|nr:hypothetical protein PHPALM_19118 [Phytophthora palmivora]